MGLYDGIKDVAKIVQQADNIELYGRLLDLSAQALDMQEEIARLKRENEEIKRQNAIEKDIEYHIDPFLTRESDSLPIKYCAACWIDKKRLVPLQELLFSNYQCPLCKAKVVDKGNGEERAEWSL